MAGCPSAAQPQHLDVGVDDLDSDLFCLCI
jgi:hypothetical protein